MYHKLLLFIKKVILYFKPSSYYGDTDNPNTPLIKATSAPSLPDTRTMEQTVFMFQRIRTVFDFAPPIPLITEMRIINRGLSPAYHHASTQDKNQIATEITHTIRKFSHILPELDFLLSKIENVSTQKILAGETDAIKQEIITALAKISNNKNYFFTDETEKYFHDKKNYYLTFDNGNNENP